MKKLLSLLIAGVMTVCGVQAASAAEVTDDDLTAVNTSAKYKVVTTLNIKQGTMLLYPYNLSSSATDLFVMKNETKDTSRTIYFKEFYNRPKSISISSSDTYTPYMGCGGGYGGGGSFTYNNTGGKYDVIKVKISDLISGLNKDGSVTKYNSALKKDVTYKFTEQFEDNGDKFYSALFFESGAAVTCATPDKNGEVEIVVSRNPAHRVAYSTNFGYTIVSAGGLTTGGGGGTNRGSVIGLRMGDADMDGYVDVSDVTYIQRISAGEKTRKPLQKRSGDMDRDGVISITDATVLQMYIANYDISRYYK